MLNSIAHSNLELVSSLLVSTILPIVYAETRPNPSLIRTVDYGPFKHQVDDGLPLRRAAFTCMDTLVDVASNRLIYADFAESLKCGFSDDTDIQQISYGILTKFALNSPRELLEVLDLLPDPIMKSIKLQLKLSKGNDPEQARVTLRSAIRALDKIRRIPGAEQIAKFDYLYSRVQKTANLAEMLKEIESEDVLNRS
jgi:cullin-associated NEDD8-dissociated protein 1